MARQQAPGVLHAGRTLEFRLEQVSDLPNCSDNQSEYRTGQAADVRKDQELVDPCKYHVARQPADSTFDGLFGADRGTEFMATEHGPDIKGSGVPPCNYPHQK